MTRFALLAFAAFGLAAVPASAQDDPTAPTAPMAPADTVATDSVETIEPDPARARELYNAGRESLSASDYESALASFDEALVFNETYAAAALGRGQALAQLRRFEDSRAALEQAVAFAAASEVANADQIGEAASSFLERINAVIEQQQAASAAAAEQQAAAAGAQAVQQKVTRATEMLSGNEIDMATATDAYALLEQARLDGYDPNNVAFFYAKALNAMERGADAIPYAETALEQNADAADTSVYYIQLGLAHMGAGNTEEARAAFESIAEGQQWHGWAQHYIGQLDA